MPVKEPETNPYHDNITMQVIYSCRPQFVLGFSNCCKLNFEPSSLLLLIYWIFCSNYLIHCQKLPYWYGVLSVLIILYHTLKATFSIFINAITMHCGFNLFHLYIYPPDSQESNGGANTYIGKAITPNCFQRSQDIAVRLKFFICFFTFQEI